MKMTVLCRPANGPMENLSQEMADLMADYEVVSR
jgi:hypothetical protein